MPISKQNLSGLCEKILPILLSLFLLSFIWTRSWSLISGIFYTTMIAGLFVLNRTALKSIKRQWFAFLFIGWFSISTLWSPAATVGNVTDILRYAFCILMLLAILSTPAREKIRWQWIPAAAFIPALAGMVAFYIKNPLHIRLEHFGKYPVSSAGLYAFFAIIALWNLRPSGEKKIWINTLPLITFMLALLLTQSRGPVLGFITACATIAGVTILRRFRPQPHQIAVLLAALLITAPQVFAEIQPPPAPTTVTEATQSFLTRGTTYRTAIWKSTIDQMPNHWLTGYGLYAPYTWLETRYAEYGIPYSVPHLHSLFFWALYHGGLIGLGLTLLLITQAAQKALRSAVVTGNWLPLALLAAGLFCCVFGGNKYIYRPRGEWIIFWIPICYALTCQTKPSLKPQVAADCT